MLRNSLRLTALCAGLLLGANAMALSLAACPRATPPAASRML